MCTDRPYNTFHLDDSRPLDRHFSPGLEILCEIAPLQVQRTPYDMLFLYLLPIKYEVLVFCHTSGKNP